MPRKMPAGSMTFLARKDKQAETHTTLQISINNGDLIRDYYFASATLTLNGNTYAPLLQQGSQIRSSLSRASDQAAGDLFNVSTALGREFLSLGTALYGAAVKLGRVIRDRESMIDYHKVFLTGVLVGLPINENTVQIVAVSEPYANISVGATRRVVPLCQWQFREPNTCGYNGSLLVCNFMINDAGGCQGRHGDPLKRAKFGGFPYINSKSRLVAQ